MRVNENVYKQMPEHLKRLFVKLPNPAKDEVVQGFPQTTSGNLNAGHKRGETSVNYTTGGGTVSRDYGGDSGSAARFFYCAKASKAERNMGCEKNNHPTVKPVSLMRYLCRLITPPNGTVLDPFAGSGSTLIAAKQEGFNYVGIEMEAEYIEIAKRRLESVKEQKMFT